MHKRRLVVVLFVVVSLFSLTIVAHADNQAQQGNGCGPGSPDWVINSGIPDGSGSICYAEGRIFIRNNLTMQVVEVPVIDANLPQECAPGSPWVVNSGIIYGTGSICFDVQNTLVRSNVTGQVVVVPVVEQ